MSRGCKSVHYDSASPLRDEPRHKSTSPPRRRLDMRRRDSISPFSRNSSVSRRHSASRSQSRADTYRGTYSGRRQSTPSPPRRNRYGARAHTRTTWFGEESSSSESDYESNKLRSWGLRHNDGPPFKHLDSIAKDIERFDPEKQDHNVEDYLRELEHCLLDLPGATRQVRVKLIWKTMSRSVRAFIKSQPPLVRDSFSWLSRALIEEFSPFANETSATISALQIRHCRSETPKEFYNRLKHAFFQERNGPGLTEDRAFKSLFLHNLHPCVRTHVTLMTQKDNPPMREIRRMAQAAWEMVVRTGDSSATLYSPRITGGIQANEVAVQAVIVALWPEKSAVRQDLYDIIRQNDANLPFVQKSHRLLSAELPQAPVKSIGVCALTLQIGRREFVHYVSVAPHLSHSFYIGVDILGRNKLIAQPEQMCSGQTVPLACHQELAKVTNTQYFSTVNVSNGFWTMKVDPADQYKLAFSFANRQFTWNFFWIFKLTC
ncbi:hypothetical protein SKAU_G00415730 [Synaphobranchus kaupii]|uniref:Uncharacterized protein n=1 Tax=Synaphobranchus kaupii TaxID=118154 RepID=A0A9Q1E7F6_SYNKA|nr:hypothetical protein SKAU_G00415730 [Synaphobranchus kaupii]